MIINFFLKSKAPKKPLQSETPSDQNNTIFSQRHGAEPIKETIDLVIFFF